MIPLAAISLSGHFSLTSRKRKNSSRATKKHGFYTGAQQVSSGSFEAVLASERDARAVASLSSFRLSTSSCPTPHPPSMSWSSNLDALRPGLAVPTEAWDVRVLLEPTSPDFAMVQPSLFGTEDDDIDFATAISRASGS